MDFPGLDDRPTVAGIALTLAVLAENMPAIRGLAIERVYAGLLPETPDALPVLDPEPGVEGLVINAGHVFGNLAGPLSGKMIAQHLVEPTVVRIPFEKLVHEMLEQLGEDPKREGLQNTPSRVEASLKWLTRGYSMSVQDVIGDAIFHEKHENMICVRDIEIYSMCEHHMLPFFGRAHVAYLPDGKIVGLSKIPRVVEVFARRLQVQERLTDQVADALCAVLKPLGVGVVIEAYHLCMMMRGVEKQNSKTVTSALRGAFRDDAKTRDEFLRLVHGGNGLA